MKQQMTIYYINNFLYNFARVLPHAVLSVILLSKGLAFSEIAFIQSMYMLGALLFEFPSGILSDIFSEKKLYLASVALIAIAYSIVFVGSTFIVLALAWFIYGVSASAMSGTLDTFFIKELKRNDNDIKQFMVNDSYTILFSALIGGALGGFMYQFIGLNIYFISIAIFLSVLIFVSLGISVEDQHKKDSLDKQIKELKKDLRSLLEKKEYVSLIIIIILSSITIQIFFQFWQLIYLDKNIPSAWFGWIYPAFQLCSLISNYIFKKFNHYSFLNYIYIILSTLLFLSGLMMTNNSISIICFFGFFIILGVYGSQMSYEFQQQSHHQSLSTMTSLLGTMSTFAAMLVLWAISFCLQYFALEHILIVIIVMLSTLSSLVYWKRYMKTDAKNDEKEKVQIVQD